MKAGTLLFTFTSRLSNFAQSTNYMSASKRLKLSSMTPPRQTTSSAIVRFYDPDVQAKDALGRTQEQILAWSNSQLENSHNYIQMLFPLPEGSPYNWSAPVIDLETMKAFHTKSKLRQRLRMSFERMLAFYGFTTSIHPGVEEQKIEDEVTEKNNQEQTNDTPSSTATTMEPNKNNNTYVPSSSSAIGDATITHEGKTSIATETPSAEVEASRSKSQSQLFGYYVIRGSNWHEASRNWCVRMDHNHLRITRILRCLRVLGCQTECDAFFVALKRVYNDPSVQIGPRSMEFWTRAVKRPLYVAPDDDKCEWLKVWEEEQGRESRSSES